MENSLWECRGKKSNHISNDGCLWSNDCDFSGVLNAITSAIRLKLFCSVRRCAGSGVVDVLAYIGIDGCVLKENCFELCD